MPNNGDQTPVAGTEKLSKLNVPAELHQRARAAVRIVRRVTGRRYTIAQFVTEAFVAQLAVIARDYNGGREIYPDREPLERGRRSP
ncbi:50S ribosomal protein L7ae (plasmid) [Mycolicibacterium vanbaalenii]|uniref:hypothetical protein n=1 Tax=Mycolicibacterium vanbaalenii TaxID=110539 RepID=UPI001F1FCC46|nr:hypothetical protein [Mycolicibacterium vanbaalenii]UJL32227.1 50S ribosomal protein L7ae [Mycolicibacterium vanbaalenii]WND60137.1 hypothetical protein QQA43_30285 [Mycolicibacterium vanbaalenii]